MREYISSIIIGIVTIIVVIIRDRGKSKRIDKLKHLNNSKIESIGNYEEKSKTKNLLKFNFWSKPNNK